MSEFKQFKRKEVAELRPVTQQDIDQFNEKQHITVKEMKVDTHVSISGVDVAQGSPKIGDMIARNPKNNADQWLVAQRYFEDNFEPL